MTIKDIASMAGVSNATVSRFLNGGYVSKDKRDIIRKVIEETGYEPNVQARMLRNKKARAIGVIIPNTKTESVMKMLEGISLEAGLANYVLLLANARESEKEELIHIKNLKSHHVDGIILVGTNITDEHKKLIMEEELPIVILSQKVENKACVYFNDYDAAREVAKTVLKNAKNVAYIVANDSKNKAVVSRYKGFMSAIDEKTKKDKISYLIKASDDTIEAGKNACEQIISKYQKVDAIVCVLDNLALGALEYLKEIGKNIPKDIQVVGMGDIEAAKISTPKLSSVSFPYEQAGVAAIKLLVNLIDKDEYFPMEIKLAATKVMRETTI